MLLESVKCIHQEVLLEECKDRQSMGSIFTGVWRQHKLIDELLDKAEGLSSRICDIETSCFGI